jgi:putative ABC transport system permease protein
MHRWLHELTQDLRFGARSMLRTPGFTAVALIALALGIGANTAIFSVVNAVLLRPLAYRDPDRLVTLLHDGENPVAPANYLDWRDQSRSFETMAAADYWTPNLTGVDPPEHLWALQVTQNLMPMLGVEPLFGRLFAPGEDQRGAEHVVVLSYRLWQRRFAGDRSVLGRAITLNGEPYTVIGVMPGEFRFAPFWATRAELWAPNVLSDRAHNRGGNSLRIFARLGSEITLGQARSEIAAITARLEQQYPGTNRRVRVTPLKENVVGRVETPMMVLLGAVGFVLLIACANVAHMLLARAAGRQREIALRAAIGAGRGRIARQFLAESLLLASVGAALGLVLAVWGTRALVAFSPPEIPRLDTVAVDGRAVLFLAGITVLAAIAFGLAPAMQASWVNLTASLKEGSRGSGESFGRNRLRSVLVASEFALALMLLVGAGLMIRSFSALLAVDPGFDPHHVLSMIVSVSGSPEAEPGRRSVFYRQLLERVRALPGVDSAGGINHLPLAGDVWGWPFAIEGRPKPRPGESPWGVYRIAMPGYFRAMRLPILRGREIAETDDASAPGVVVVNERAAARYWPDEGALGKRISFDDGKTWLSVIGVVKNAKQSDWTEDIKPEVYLAALQNREFMTNPKSHMGYLTLVVRASGDPASLTAAVKSTVWSFDRNLPISEVLTMDGVVADANAEPRFEMLLLGMFAAVALVLAAVGIYGVMSYSVSRRTHEIGVRISLGATRADVLRLVMRQGLTLAFAGSAAGAAGALMLSRLMTKVLFGVKPTDPVTFAAVVVVLTLVALIATYVPARRATCVDPMTALRAE